MGVNMMRAGAQTGAVSSSKRYHWQQPLADAASHTEFPIVPVGPDGYDDVANIKSQYAAAGAGQTNWVVPFDQSDAAFIMRKRDQEEKAQFDAWATQKYDLTDPAQNMMLQQIAPELYQRREELIDSQQDMVSRYAKLRLRGAKSLEDLYFEWLIETKRLELPQGPIWNPRAWRAAQRGQMGDSAWQNQRYQAGFFSPLKFMSNTQTGSVHNANYFDVTGGADQFNPTKAQRYALPRTADNSVFRYPNAYPGDPFALGGLFAGADAAGQANMNA